MRAVFLDRDGTIVKNAGHLSDIRDLRVLPAAVAAIRKLNRLGYVTIIITNQSAVAYGFISESYLNKIHAVLIKRLAKKGAKIDAIYYCPHHPEGKIKKYRLSCDCRKPNVGMVMKAAKELNVDLKKSFFVGDATADILTGERAGLKTILVGTGYAGCDGIYDVMPDFTAKDLNSAANIIKRNAK
jgi:D,D-heptose 1,7-bisphosphate phosphatase